MKALRLGEIVTRRESEEDDDQLIIVVFPPAANSYTFMLYGQKTEVNFEEARMKKNIAKEK